MFSLLLSHGWLSFLGTTSCSTLPLLLFPPSGLLLFVSSSRLFIPVILFLVSASAWVTPHGDVATSRDGCHRLEAVICQLILILYTHRGSLLNSADRTSCPTLLSRPARRPTRSPQGTLPKCRFRSIFSSRAEPLGRSSSRFFRVAPGSPGVFGVGPHFHQS